MVLNMGETWRELLTILRKTFVQIMAVHLAYVAFGFALFTPLLGLVGQLLLRLSGKPMLADQDIVYFLLTPSGIIGLILMAAILITIIAFEQASLMAIAVGVVQGVHVGLMQALFFTVARIFPLFFFAIRLVGRILLIVLPFLAAGTAIAWFLITDYDINYYLTEKPSEFLLAMVLIGSLLLAMLLLLLRKLLSWSLALPLVLFHDISPAASFSKSEKLSSGHKQSFFLLLGSWGLASLLLSSFVLGCMQLLGSQIVPFFFDSIRILVVVLGGLVALWSGVNFFLTMCSSGSFAVLLILLAARYGPGMNTTVLRDQGKKKHWQLTAPRFALLLAAGTAISLLVGTFLLHSIQTEDAVQIIAHRGAAGKAPENTMASVRQAIADDTDWIEIDVQESVDGEVMVIHDSDLMKLAGVDLKVWDGSVQQFGEIDIGSWFDPAFSGERMPTLAEVLMEAKGKARVMIELKYYGHDKQLEQRVVDIVEQTQMVADVAIMSLKYKGVQKLKALRPDWESGLLIAKSIGNSSKMDVDFLAVNMGMATSSFIRKAQDAGKKVYVWTVNDQVSMSQMMSLGVDGIITDEPELARKVLADRAELSSLERLLIRTALLVRRPIPAKTYRDQSP